MNKIVLVDGNNLMFRSYFATAYTGNLMKNSKGQVTNALYGFANMINKILKEECDIFYPDLTKFAEKEYEPPISK